MGEQVGVVVVVGWGEAVVRAARPAEARRSSLFMVAFCYDVEAARYEMIENILKHTRYQSLE